MAKRILVVDDSASVRTVAGIALREAGYEVLEAANGQEGLTRLNGERIHLVISDVNMPVLDGIGFLKQIKAFQDREPLDHFLHITDIHPVFIIGRE